MRAKGSFEVELRPLDVYNDDPDAELGRMSIDKSFAGDLVATSRGEMLSGGSPRKGSAGYVAMERVTGSLQGREGSFTLQHSSTMTPREQSQSIVVVPGSGTGALEGLAGSMRIEIREARHFYVLDYTLPDSG